MNVGTAEMVISVWVQVFEISFNALGNIQYVVINSNQLYSYYLWAKFYTNIICNILYNLYKSAQIDGTNVSQ